MTPIEPLIPTQPAHSSYDLASFERLVRIETTLGLLMAQKGSEHADMAKDIADVDARGREGYAEHEGRIRAIERAWWKSGGMAGLISGPVAAAVALIITYVTRGGTP